MLNRYRTIKRSPTVQILMPSDSNISTLARFDAEYCLFKVVCISPSLNGGALIFPLVNQMSIFNSQGKIARTLVYGLFTGFAWPMLFFTGVSQFRLKASAQSVDDTNFLITGYDLVENSYQDRLPVAFPSLSMTGSPDFGTVNLGEPAQVTLTFTNDGEADLILNSYDLSDWINFDVIYVGSENYFSQSLLRPGESVNLTFSLDSGTEGTYSSLVSLLNNSADSPFEFTLTAEVVS